MATYNGNDNNNIYNGTTDADTIYGNGGNDILKGAGGNDYINGGDGNDTITGGNGNDTLVGEGGADTYVFSSGDGQDTIKFDWNDNPSKDVVKFTDVASTAVTVSHSGNHMVLSYGGTDKLTLQEGLYDDYAYTYPDYKISQFQFSDGVVWT